MLAEADLWYLMLYASMNESACTRLTDSECSPRIADLAEDEPAREPSQLADIQSKNGPF
jgi:hypothetical protein